VAVLPPSVNESLVYFNVVDVPSGTAIRFGLGGIKGVGKIADDILAQRATGPFVSFFDFVDRLHPVGLNKKALEALVVAGACDEFGHRRQLLDSADEALAHAARRKKELDKGQTSLFDMLGSATPDPSFGLALKLSDVAPMDVREMLRLEKEVLDFYVSGHPMQDREKDAAQVRTHTIAAAPLIARKPVTLVGIVTSVKKRVAKKSGNEYGNVIIEDLTGQQALAIFGDSWARLKDKFVDGEVLAIRGSFKEDGTEESRPDMMVDSADPLDVALSAGKKLTLKLVLPARPRAGDPVTSKLQELFAQFPGSVPVEFVVGEGDPLTARSKVRPDVLLIEALRAVLGYECVTLHEELLPPPAPSERRMR
jgi:DNA polymerase-3 subunit alpha